MDQQQAEDDEAWGGDTAGAPEEEELSDDGTENGDPMEEEADEAAAAGGIVAAAPASDSSNDEEENEEGAADSDEEDEDSNPEEQEEVVVVRPRGKPEAMAAALAAKHAAANRLERDLESSSASSSDSSSNDDEGEDDDASDNDDNDDEAQEVVAVLEDESVPAAAVAEAVVPAAAAVVAKSPSKGATAAKKGATGTPKKRPPASAKATATPTSSTPKKKRPASASATPNGVGSPAAVPKTPPHVRTELLLSDSAPAIKPAEWDNLEALMLLFCKVPLLAEFSRPVSLLHPELVAGYSKIVLHPVDLGHVCRGIRRRQYRCLRDVRLDMWRVFANCVKFHSHPHNKEAVPSFVSIALHLREYFNMLWQEFMLPSDVPEDATHLTKLAFRKRAEDRKHRIENSGVLVMTRRYLLKTAQVLLRCVERGGTVDGLDTDPVFSVVALARNSELHAVHTNITAFASRLADPETAPEEYSLEEFYKDLHGCFEGDLMVDQPALRNRINNRLERLFWKRTVPLHEGNTRGVGQSSIWGNVAATIWARENSKKPYWPALCLGILPPRDQREGWHAAVTERNESRLPEKLRVQLVAAKKKCEQAQKRQNLSYFLVEFLGTHEFIWVRELDIVEKFDPAEDPNKSANVGGKKKRASRSDVASVVKSKTYLTALEECKWAQEEFENVLQDVLDDEPGKESEEDDTEMNYSFAVLAQSDDEADDEDVHGFQYDEGAMSDSDTEEANYLLEHDGMLDVRAIAAKKKAKKKPPVSAKKKPVSTVEKEKEDASRKAKAELLKKKNQEKEDRKELRELERRRKKRSREREKALRDEARKQKRRRASQDSEEGAEHDLAWDKRARASAIAKAYLHRATKRNEEYKSLALNGVLQLPSAMVDPTGLLGMALAFRAAAGVLTMPDDSEEQITKSTKPWAAIDSTSAASSADRTAQLEIKMKMLEKEIHRVRANTNRRRVLTEEAIAQRLALDQQVEIDDAAARFNHFKRKKKPPSGRASGAHDADEAQDDDENVDESMLDVDEDASIDEKVGGVVPVEALADDEDMDDDEEEPVRTNSPAAEVGSGG